MLAIESASSSAEEKEEEEMFVYSYLVTFGIIHCDSYCE